MIVTWSGGGAWTIAETSGALFCRFTFCKCWLNALQNKSLCEEMLSVIYSLCYNGLCCPIQSQITCAYLLDSTSLSSHCPTLLHDDPSCLSCTRWHIGVLAPWSTAGQANRAGTDSALILYTWDGGNFERTCYGMIVRTYVRLVRFDELLLIHWLLFIEYFECTLVNNVLQRMAWLIIQTSWESLTLMTTDCSKSMTIYMTVLGALSVLASAAHILKLERYRED